MERWKPVDHPILGEIYQVSDSGLVKSIDRTDPDGKRVRKGRILAPAIVRGYAMVLMQRKPIKWFARVHHVVAFSFLGRPDGEISPSQWQINHKNGNKLDNRLCNLEWVTQQQNTDHSVAMGLKVMGERHYRSILTNEAVQQMRRAFAAGTPISEIAKQYGASHGTASAVVHNRTWKHLLRPAQ